MKKMQLFALVFSLIACFVLAVFSNPAYSGDDMPSPQAEEFWNYIMEKNFYKQWKFYPGYKGIYPGNSPHGAYLKLYANDIAYKAAKKGNPMPEGAILVKENYGKDKKTLMAITPMYKAPDYNPDGGDWFWAKYSPEGKAAKSGKIKSCISCHKNMGNMDYVVTEPK